MNPMLLTDFYKIGHYRQYPEGTEVVYSNLTARSSRHDDVDGVTFFGLQVFVCEYLIGRFNDDFFNRDKKEVVNEYKRIIGNTIGDLPDYKHIEDLHDLGYLPLHIKAVPEGTKVPIKVPMMTIVNTVDKFFWLTNFIESLMSAQMWLPITSATLANRYRLLFNEVLDESIGDSTFTDFMGHDFSFRGMEGVEASMLSGLGHLTSFAGTDTIPAILGAEKYYYADVEKELVGTSVSATEHSVISSGTAIYGEFETFRKLITEIYPNGIISMVSDTFNLWQVLTDFLPRLKDDILARDGKVVIRPDSGDPVDIICGLPHIKAGTPEWQLPKQFVYKGIVYKYDGNFHTEQGMPYELQDIIALNCKVIDDMPEAQIKGVIELLWETFGGTEVNGFKVLDEHIGAIYGDAINLDRAEQISQRLMDKGFAPIIVYGIGSFTYQYNTRDTFGMAMKCTAIVHEGRLVEVFKDPVTDRGTKKSLKGLVQVYEDDHGEIQVKDQCTWEEESKGLLKTVFLDGDLVNPVSLEEIRETVRA